MNGPVAQLDLTDPAAVAAVFHSGAAANRSAACRAGATDHARTPITLIATGDLHDNPLHLARLVSAARLDRFPSAAAGDAAAPRSSSPAHAASDADTEPHITFHEIIHSDRLINGMDFSFRALARVAALKAAFPERVHTLLANHELAQIVGAGIVKDGLNVVAAFNDAVDYAFGSDARAVHDAIADFIRSMPLALRCHAPPNPDGTSADLLCTHSLPAPDLLPRFDPTVLDRDLSENDYIPRRGSAHLLVWGRGHQPAHLDALARDLRAGLFILGHEKAEAGVTRLAHNAVVVNTDHAHARYLTLRTGTPLTADQAIATSTPLADASTVTDTDSPA